MALRHSIQFRLSLLVTLLVASVLAVFLWAANRTLERIIVRASQDRASLTASQLATALSLNSVRGLTEVQRIARDRALVDFLRTGSPELRPGVELRLRVLAVPGQGPVSLLDAKGQPLLEVRPELGPVAPIASPSGLPNHTGIGPLEVVDGLVLSDVVAEVRVAAEETAGQRPASGALGFLVVRRIAGARLQGSELISRLVGAGALVALGNRAGPVWTDFPRPISSPPIDATKVGAASYVGRDGEVHLGGLGLVEGTPWALWIDLPESRVLAPARLVFRRLALLALAGIVVAAVGVVWIGAHVARPLRLLTDASESITSGDYSRQVNVSGPGEVGRLGAAFNVMVSRVSEAQRELEERVQHRTARLEETREQLEERVRELEETRAALEQQAAELAAANHELEAFSYSVSHDLRAPLRHITGFADLVLHSAASKLDEQEMRRLNTIADAGTRMGRLIDELLAFSRTSRAPMTKRRVRLGEAVQAAKRELAADPVAARTEWILHELPEVEADPAMLHLVLVNLISNALKYSRARSSPSVEIGTTSDGKETVVFVRDNGVGFDMRYAGKLFGVFQRLHGNDEFEGVGIGLANVRRIVHRHGGRAWAEGVVDGGATFYFTLPTPAGDPTSLSSSPPTGSESAATAVV